MVPQFPKTAWQELGRRREKTGSDAATDDVIGIAMKRRIHKVLTYVEYRAMSDVFQNIDPPPPSPPDECVLPPPNKSGGTHSPGREGGQYFGRRET